MAVHLNPVSYDDLPEKGLRVPAGNRATGLLKWIALFFMFIDHSGKMLFGNMYELRLLGRIAFPLYVWCIIVGFHRTRSVPKYLLRILLTGLLSQPLYVLALNHTWTEPNIFLSLFLGLCVLWGIREKKWYSHLWAPVAGILLAGILKADYGWRGIMLFILLYAVRDSRPGIAAVMISFLLFWGSFYGMPGSLFGIPLNWNVLPDWISSPLKSFVRLETFALLSLPLILIRFKKDLRLPVWLSYALYPAHLALLYALEKLV